MRSDMVKITGKMYLLGNGILVDILPSKVVCLFQF